MNMKRLLAIALLVVPLALGAQELRVASYNMERLGQNHKDYPTLARVIADFDVVAAEEVMNTKGPSAVMAQLGSRWGNFVSIQGEGSKSYQEHFGFFYDEKVEFARDLGEYSAPHEFLRPPYALQFRVKSTGFIFNLVACHIIYGKSEKERIAEISHLQEVYRYFEGLSQNRGITIIVGDFNEDKSADFSSLTSRGDNDAIPAGGTTMGTRGPDHFYDHMFIPSNLQPRIHKAGVDYWTTDFVGSRKNESDHFPVFVVMDVKE
jgi:endonuclease/exonuclease/phosphatase family metal-dependent hydrolase